MRSGGSPPRIAIVLPDLRAGGAERMRVNLANHWVARGYAVEFVLLQGRGELYALLSSKITVVDLGAARVRHAVVSLRGYLKRTRPDVTLVAMWPLTSAAVVAWVLAGRPGRLILSDHNQLSLSTAQLNVAPALLKTLLRTTYPFASAIIAVSKGVKEDLCRLGGFPQSAVRVVYNPAATGIASQREPGAVRDQLWGEGFRFHILSVGTLKKVKDHDSMIRAFARLPTHLNAKLTILGEGDLRPALEALVVELGLQARVGLPGFFADPAPWFRSADLFVLSSRSEGFGNVLVEALECGVPIVSTDCPSGPREILQDGTYGRLVPMGDVQSLAEAIEAALLERPDPEVLKARARDFSVGKISDQYLDAMVPGRTQECLN